MDCKILGDPMLRGQEEEEKKLHSCSFSAHFLTTDVV